MPERTKKLRAASDGQSLPTFAQEKSSDEDGLGAECRNALSNCFVRVTLLGFSKSKIAARVAAAVEKNEVNVTSTFPPNVDIDCLDANHTNRQCHLRDRS